jgi:succinate dehydrogenase / fumarate reductase flavoprotein subunit
MLQLARVIAQGARCAMSRRGAHYKPDFPDRNDEKFLKTTKAVLRSPDAEPKLRV